VKTYHKPEKKQTHHAFESFPTDMKGTHVRVFKSSEQLEELRPIWTFWQQHPNADMDVYLSVIRSLPGVIRPHVLVLYRDGSPRAMLVGRLELGLVETRVGYLTVFKSHARMMTFIHGGQLGSTSPQDAELLVREVLSLLKSGEADAAFFSHFDTESSIYHCAVKLPGFLTRDHVPNIAIHRKIVLPESVQQFYGSFTGKTRSTLKRKTKKLNEYFGSSVQVRCFRKTKEINEMLRDVEEIAKKTYQRGLGVGFKDDFGMRERLRLAAERCWLRAYVLYLNGIPAAFWMGVLYKGTFHSDYLGYDPEYGKHSPGMYLIGKVIEDLCSEHDENRAEAIDFGLGDAQYKEVLGNVEWRDGALFIFAPTFTAVARNVVRTAFALSNWAARRIVRMTGSATKIRRLWRDSAIRHEARADQSTTEQ
jgi:hypothetical protein